MRGQGQYGDPSANTYVATQMHQIADQWMEKHRKFEAQLEAFTPERENPFADSKPNDQWRWETDGSNSSNSMASRMFRFLSLYASLCTCISNDFSTCIMEIIFEST